MESNSGLSVHPSTSMLQQRTLRSISTKKNDKRCNLPKKAETPLRTSYHPELDVSPELHPTQASYYMSLIGILRYIVELGRINICLECSMISSHLYLPREGHLYQVFHFFGYPEKHHNTEMVFGPSNPVVNELSFEKIFLLSC